MKSEIIFMNHAIDLAKKGLYSTTPNPSVGCVIVENGEIISEGFHLKAGLDHAEIIALKKINKQINKNMTMYITLEPCCHHGRTGPCTKQIIDLGIKNIFVAMLDPNPKVNGKGVEILRKNGINVHVGLCKNEAKKINQGYISRIVNKLPYIIAKQAMSIDCKINSPNKKWISNSFSREDSHILRASSCAIMVSANTVKSDNPKLTARINPKKLEFNRKIKNPIRVILDNNLNLNVNKYFVFKGNEKKIIFNSVSSFKNLEKNIDYIKVEKDKSGLKLKKIFSILASTYEINILLIEPGQKLLTSLLQKKILNELIIYKCPVILGNSGLDFCLLQNNTFQNKNISLKSINKLLNDVKINYEFFSK